MTASVGRKAGAGFAWTSGARLFGRIVDTIVLLVLARVLDPTAFGLVALATSLLAIVQLFQDLGLMQAAIQRKEVTSGELSSLFWGVSSIGLILSLGMFAASPAFGALFQNQALVGVVAAMSPILFLQALILVPTAVFQREMKFKPMATRRAIGAIAGGIVGVTLALLGAGAFAMVGRVLIDNVLGVILLWAASPFRPKWFFSFASLWIFLRFGLPVAGARALETLQTRSDDLLIGRFLGAASLGLYSVAYQAFRILTELLLGASNQVLSAAFARLQGDHERLRRAYYRSIRATSLVAIPGFVGIAAVGYPFVEVLFGPQWTAAVPVLQMLAVLGVIQSVRYYDAALLIAMGRPKVGLSIRLITVPITIAGYVYALQFEDLVVFALVQVIVALFISTPIWLVVLYRVAGVKPLLILRASYVALTGGAVMFAVVWLLERAVADWPNVLQLAVCVPAGAAVYLGVLWILDRGAITHIFGVIRERRRRGKG
ncbi:lipopolysaccharide biosynthesis protein [Microbacterium pumilum]|uniref:Lipopolysaccharide biosynthesis protein n=2 Tax=Microbacterium pumilum TaxID=344165 RepID=A0ABN2S9G6_9MICO